MKTTEWITTLARLQDLKDIIKGDYLKGYPEPRVAMVGRSNVGKSSLLNAIFGKKLARVSQTPGKTRTIHFYTWKEGNRILVDLPGYGFAKAPRTEQEQWKSFIADYLQQDPRLERVCLLIDSRNGPTPLDMEALSFLEFYQIPIEFVFTKLDGLKNQSERARRKSEIEEFLAKCGYPAKCGHWVSVVTKEGLKPLIGAISKDPHE